MKAPVSLLGNKVELIPLERKHKYALVEAAQDGNLWELWYTSVPSAETVDAYLDKAFLQMENGSSIPFVIVDKATGKIIGSTRYCNIDTPNKRLEIGYTWYAKSYQRTGINTECKLLLLTHAFEKMGCIAVELRTHFHNVQSRNAIARLGAKQDGILRNHQIDPTGHLRDTVVFSIINSEWETVKKSLTFKMNR